MNENHTATYLKLLTFYPKTRKSSVAYCCVSFFVQYILELKQCPRSQVFLKSIQHSSLGNDVTSSDKNIVIAWLKHIFISKFFAQHIQCILRTHICNRILTKAEFYQFKQYLIGIYMAKIPHSKLTSSTRATIAHLRVNKYSHWTK